MLVESRTQHRRALSPKLLNLLAFIVALFAVAGILLATIVHDDIGRKVQDGLSEYYTLSSDAAGGYPEWESTDAPGATILHADFYVYNVTNPWAVVHDGAKPNLTSVGPLRFLYKQQKIDVSWDEQESGDIIMYHEWQYYVPADAQTEALLELNVTSIYVPLVGFLNSPFGRDTLAFFRLYEGTMDLFTNRSMREIIFGWEDPLLIIIRALFIPDLPTQYPGLQGNDTSAEQAVRGHSRNRMYTGLLTRNLARELVTWDGFDQILCCAYGPCGDADSGNKTAVTPPWHSDAAEQIQGTTGNQFRQNLADSDTLRVSTHGLGIYRWWPFVRTGGYEISGVDVGRYQMAPGTMGNSSVSPEEAVAYDNHGPSGLLNMTTCKWSAPIYMSKPSFLDGSPSLRAAIDGLEEPSYDRHDSYLSVEPMSGQTIDFHIRFAINVLVQPILVSDFVNTTFNTTYFPNVSAAYIPLLWADRYGTASDDQLSAFKSRVYWGREFMAAARWGGSVLTIVASLGVAALLVVSARRRRAIEQGRELQSAAYFSSFYRPFLSPEALLTLAPPLDDADDSSDPYARLRDDG